MSVLRNKGRNNFQLITMVDKLFSDILFPIGDQSCKAMNGELKIIFSFFFAESLAEMRNVPIFAGLLTKSITRFSNATVVATNSREIRFGSSVG